MVIWKPDPYVICPICNRVNFLRGYGALGLLDNSPEPEVMECDGCQCSQSYSKEDVLPIIPKRNENKRWGYGRHSGCYSVYLILNSCNRLIYVGRTTKSLSERMSQYEAHCCRLRPNMITSWSNPILLAMAEFGFKAFDMILLEKVFDWDLRGDREDYWICHLNSRNLLKGYNRA